MAGFFDLLTKASAAVYSLGLNILLCIAWGAYAAVFLLALGFTLFNRGVRRADKRPFLAFTNVFTAVTFALMFTEKVLPLSVIVAATFWCVGYMLYGLLVLLGKRGRVNNRLLRYAVSENSVAGEKLNENCHCERNGYAVECGNRSKGCRTSELDCHVAKAPRNDMAAGEALNAVKYSQGETLKSNVRLDHAVSVTDKLLAKELGRGDRQEAERIKTFLSLMQIKPELSPEENDRLNDNFNTLLKLMAKYNV
ncbi:MAG: hypothetical protein LUI60_06715 [Clostridia bacterium]|nr:hypothetical protein [Clostridia bacterium]